MTRHGIAAICPVADMPAPTVFVEGAEHKIGVCKACESYPNQYGNTMKSNYNYIEA
jgi:hypothetical protein